MKFLGLDDWDLFNIMSLNGAFNRVTVHDNILPIDIESGLKGKSNGKIVEGSKLLQNINYLQKHYDAFHSVVEELQEDTMHNVSIVKSLQDSHDSGDISKKQDQSEQLWTHKLQHAVQLWAMKEVKRESLDITECQHQIILELCTQEEHFKQVETSLAKETKSFCPGKLHTAQVRVIPVHTTRPNAKLRPSPLRDIEKIAQ